MQEILGLTVGISRFRQERVGWLIRHAIPDFVNMFTIILTNFMVRAYIQKMNAFKSLDSRLRNGEWARTNVQSGSAGGGCSGLPMQARKRRFELWPG